MTAAAPYSLLLTRPALLRDGALWQEFLATVNTGDRPVIFCPRPARGESGGGSAKNFGYPVQWIECEAGAPHHLTTLLRAVSQSRPDQAILLIQDDLVLPPDCWQRLAPHLAAFGAVSGLGDTPMALNPLRLLDPEMLHGLDPATVDTLVALTGSGRCLPFHQWPKGAVLLSAEAAQTWVESAPELSASQWLADGKLRLGIADHLYAAATVQSDGGAGFETAGPADTLAPVLGRLLAQWPDDTQSMPLPLPGRDGRPVTLHITHSWGGGVARWLKDFVQADREHHHLSLVSHGLVSQPAGGPAGQSLSLHLGTDQGVELGRWQLQPVISAVSDRHDRYREVLEFIIRRFAVGRVFISSLVGHSLEALRSGLPTLQVLHDHFPAWPLLSSSPADFDFDLARALADAEATDIHKEPLLGRSVAGWEALRAAYSQTLVQHDVHRVTPSRRAADIAGQLLPAVPGEIVVQPHGLGSWSDSDTAILPKTGESSGGDGRPAEKPLRLVVPGRIQSGKGKQLLLDALSAIRPHAHVYLLGAGKDGEAFFGLGGVSIIPQYDWHDLPSLIARLRPDAALLLSTVDETFSYTLSEMFSLGLPVIATRRGSFAERIEHGKTGWLVEPDAAALATRITELASARQQLGDARHHLRHYTAPSLADMAAAYNAICPALTSQAQAVPSEQPPSRDALLSRLLSQSRDGQRRLADKLEQTRQLARERSEWAESANRDLGRAKRQIDHFKQDIATLQDTVQERTDWAMSLDRRIQTLETQWQQERQARQSAMDKLQQRHQQVIDSRSWRITRPLRVGARVLRTLRDAGVHRPGRWPRLSRRVWQTWRTQGGRELLRRLQDPSRKPRFHESPLPSVPHLTERLQPQTLPGSSDPLVSIVIPVHNKYPYTQACLESIARARTGVPFEVIVVDDASTDATPRLLKACKGITRLRNRQNLGFVGSCNRGAEAARGQYLLFLNNDTAVADDWLDELVLAMRELPEAGIVGARLLFADGILQEAGGVVFSDGSAWNFGRGADPYDPRYAYSRQVDYVSGACLMIPTELFQALDGFDTHYAPAYYEDTDLAFRVRDQGRRVYVHGQVTVVHFEGVSAGTDTGAGMKRFQSVNREKFLQRWSDALAGQPAPVDDPGDQPRAWAAAEHRVAHRTLVIDAYTPEPDQDSGSVRLSQMMQCLMALGHRVTFIAENLGFEGRYTERLQSLGIEVQYAPHVQHLDDFLLQRGGEFDYVLVSRHYVAAPLLSRVRQHAPQARFIFDTVDLHYLREQREAALHDSGSLQRAALQTRKAELAVIRAADATLVVSPVEQEELARQAPAARVHVVSNIHQVRDSVPGFAERRDLFFVGGYQHPPNVDAARWFVEDIWPRVRSALPEAVFHLIGSKAPNSVADLHDPATGVLFQGFVADLDPFLFDCRLAVAPLRYGAGVKGKVNMSMSHGQPVVATPAAAEGMYVQHERELLVAGDAEAFAQAVIRLYQDEQLWQRLSRAGLRNVQQHFSRQAAKRALGRLFTDLERDQYPDQTGTADGSEPESAS